MYMNIRACIQRVKGTSGLLGADQRDHQETFQDIFGVLHGIRVSLSKNTNYVKPLAAFQNLISYTFMQFQCIQLHFILNFSPAPQSTLLIFH